MEVFPCPLSTPDNFGWDGEPYDDLTYNPSDAHNGHDIFGKNGDPLVRCVNGVIDADRWGWNDTGGWRFWLIGADGYRYYYAHCLEGSLPQPGSWGPAGELVARMDQSGEAKTLRTAPHLHIGKKDSQGNWVPDFYGELIEAYQRQFEIKKRRREPMIEQGVQTKDGWWKAGWFTHNYPNLDHSVLMVTSGFNPPSNVELSIEEEDEKATKRKFYDFGKFARHKTKKLTNQKITGTGMLWIRPIDGEILDVTVRTVFK